MPRPSESVREVEDATSDFVTAFELVFDNDWEMTKSCLENPGSLVDEDGSFISPGVDDESNNWANRGYLLAAYRKLRKVLDKHNVPVRP